MKSHTKKSNATSKIFSNLKGLNNRHKQRLITASLFSGPNDSEMRVTTCDTLQSHQDAFRTISQIHSENFVLPRNDKMCCLNEKYNQHCNFKARPWIQQILSMVCPLVWESRAEPTGADVPLLQEAATMGRDLSAHGSHEGLHIHRNQGLKHRVRAALLYTLQHHVFLQPKSDLGFFPEVLS